MVLLLRAAVLALFVVAPTSTAQLKVSVQSRNDAGLALERSNSMRSVLTLPSKVDLTSYTQVRILEQGPYTSVLSSVYPPFQIGSSISNRVKFASAVQVLKKSGHKSLHLTDTKAGAAGVQKFRVTLTTTKATPVKIDVTAFARIYDASDLGMKLTIGTMTRSWSRKTPGSKLDTDSFAMNVNGSAQIDVEMRGVTLPGTGTDASARYEGFSASLGLNFLVIGDGSFTKFGTGCAKGTLSSNGVPVRGSWFEVRLNGERPGALGICLFGDSRDKFGSVQLPLAYGAKGCFLNIAYTSPWAGIVDSSGSLKLRSLVPAFLPTSKFYVQWLVVDLTNPLATTSTRAAEVKY